MRNFIDINQIYTDRLDSDNYCVYRTIMTQNDFDTWFKNPDASMIAYKDLVKVGKEYTILYHKHLKKPMMSNHETELVTNQKFIDNAKGDVLIFGLGLGLIVFPLLEDNDIKSIDIVEIDKSLISIIEPIIKKKDIHNKVRIIHGDVETYHLFESNQRMYDTIYFDTWFDPIKAVEEQIRLYYFYYSTWLKNNGYMDAWTNKTTKHNI